MDDRLPALLTIQEAGELLRIGRTKAYAMAVEWRETEGRSGLPVVDLGNVLRVPLKALEDLLGVELTSEAVREREQPAASAPPARSRAAARPPAAPSRNVARRRAAPRQAPLFETPPATAR